MIGPYTMFYNSGGTSTDSMIIDASGATPTYTQVANSSFPHMTGPGRDAPDRRRPGGRRQQLGQRHQGHAGDDARALLDRHQHLDQHGGHREAAHLSLRRGAPAGRPRLVGRAPRSTRSRSRTASSSRRLTSIRKDGSGQLATRPTATDAPASVARGPVVLDRDEQPVEHRLRLVHPHGRNDAPGERGAGVREAERDARRPAASR